MVLGKIFAKHHDEDPQVSSTSERDEEVVHKLFSVKFIGSMLGFWFGMTAEKAGWVLAVNVLSIINEDIGPSTNLPWVAFVWTLAASVGFLLVGRLSDLMGRTYFFISGGILGFIGCVMSATANDINTLIGANVFIGIAASIQQTSFFAPQELVARKHRPWVVAFCISGSAVPNAFGPVIAKSFVLHTSLAWRWNYWFGCMLNGISAILFLIFYDPPKFADLHEKESRWQIVKNFDYLGLFLFVAGLVVFLLGLLWGGNKYPWKSAAVIASIVLGVLCLVALGVWDIYAKLKEPLIPRSLFVQRGFASLVIVASSGACGYYSLTYLWPSQVSSMYSTDIMHGAWLSCPVYAANLVGQTIAGAGCVVLGKRYGIKLKYQLFFLACFMTATIGAMAGATPNNVGFATTFISLGAFAVGTLEFITIIIGPLLTGENELGSTGGFIGSARTAAATVAQAIYSAVRTGKQNAGYVNVVAPAVIQAGLPPSSVPAFIKAITVGTVADVEAINGVTTEIINVGHTALVSVYTNAFKYVYITAIPISVLAILFTFFVPHVDKQLDNRVDVRLGEHRKNYRGTKEDSNT